jgi:type IV pilus assembly protein PilM
MEPGSEGPRLTAVAVREIASGCASSGDIVEPEYVAALLKEALSELCTRQRRCVCAIGEPDAVLRSVTLPAMSDGERRRGARFEAQRYVEYPLDEATVRVHPIDETRGLYALGIARTSTVAGRLDALKLAGLRPVAMEHDACVLQRLFAADYDAAIDLGHHRTNVHVFGKGTPVTMSLFTGGADITRNIERDLSIDASSAEKRKRILGTAGAGERARMQLASDIAAFLAPGGADSTTTKRIALTGNGARLRGLVSDVETATGAIVDVPVGAAVGGNYPEDVLASSAPDWNLAVGLALRGSEA